MTAVPVEKTPVADSLRARIAALDVGETVAEALRLPLAGDDLDIDGEIEKMRNRINPAVARARTHTGATYTTENGSILTRSRDLLLVFAITRTA